MLANQDTGLAEADTFYFGNRIGDTGLNTPPSVFLTSAGDELAARANPAIQQGVTNIYDFNRDSVVSGGDQLTARNNAGFLTRLNLAAPLALVAQEDDGEDAVASALNASSEPEACAVGRTTGCRAADCFATGCDWRARCGTRASARTRPFPGAGAPVAAASEAIESLSLDESLLNLLSLARSRYTPRR